MLVYSYDPQTKEYIGTEEAQESPREPGVFILPANSTESEPPSTQSGKTACWNGTKWELKVDHRGKTFWDTATQEKHKISEIGIAPKSDWTQKEPADEKAEWNGEEWIIPFNELKERKYKEIAAARYNAEIAGITINGVLIKTDRETQAVLTAACLQAYIDSGYSLNWKTGDGTFVSLPAEKIMAFGTAVRAHVQGCFDREAELLPLIASARTQAELDTIEW